MSTQHTWPFGDNIKDDGTIAIAITQRMIHHLLGREGTPENRSMMALGIEVEELRDEAGMGRSELAVLSGLDRGFLAILEAGKALPEELTSDVLMALAIGLSADSRPIDKMLIRLDEAMVI